MKILKNWLRKWLGIKENTFKISELDEYYSNLVSIGVDVHFKSPHMILIYSELNGGQLRHIDAHFESIAELLKLVKELKARYKTQRVTWDAPPMFKEYLKGAERW